MPLKVLLVYENKAVLDSVAEALVSLGLEVRPVSNVSEAGTLASRERFDGVFVDSLMSFAAGCELARRVRQAPENRGTPMFVLAVRHKDYITAHAVDALGTYFLQEPIELDGLRRLLDGTRGMPPGKRNRNPRTAVSIQVTRRDMPDVTGISSDISEDGILYRDGGSLQMGQTVDLVLPLPDDKPPIEVSGIVVRLDDGQRAVVCFTQINREDRQRIKDFLTVKPVA